MTAVLIKVTAILLITASLTLTIGTHKPEFAFILSLAGGAAVIILILGTFMPQLNEIRTVFQKNTEAFSYFSVALKSLGISYIVSFAADTCRDFGQSALAAKAEFAGKCAIFILCVPLAINIIESALKFAGI